MVYRMNASGRRFNEDDSAVDFSLGHRAVSRVPAYFGHTTMTELQTYVFVERVICYDTPAVSNSSST